MKNNFKKAMEHGISLFAEKGFFWNLSKEEMILEIKQMQKMLLEGIELKEGVLLGNFRQDIAFVKDSIDASNLSIQDRKQCEAIWQSEERLDRLIPKDFKQLSKLGKIYPPWRKVDHFMRSFFQELKDMHSLGANAIDLAAFAHQQIVHIHPFGDGNGRMARIFMNAILMGAGYAPVTFPIRKEYLEKSSAPNVKKFAQYLQQKSL